MAEMNGQLEVNGSCDPLEVEETVASYISGLETNEQGYVAESEENFRRIFGEDFSSEEVNATPISDLILKKLYPESFEDRDFRHLALAAFHKAEARAIKERREKEKEGQDQEATDLFGRFR